MDVFFTASFLIIWLAMFYGLFVFLNRILIKKGFYIAQILFFYVYFISSHNGNWHFVGLSLNDLAFIWIIASLIFLYAVNDKD